MTLMTFMTFMTLSSLALAGVGTTLDTRQVTWLQGRHLHV